MHVLELVSWNANSYEGEFNFPKGSKNWWFVLIWFPSILLIPSYPLLFLFGSLYWVLLFDSIGHVQQRYINLQGLLTYLLTYFVVLGWKSTDLYKTISVPYMASFLITEVLSATKLKVRTANYVQNIMTIKSGGWKLYDFRAGSWVLSEDECRHVIDPPRKHMLDVDLGHSAKVEISLNLKGTGVPLNRM